MKKYRHLRGTLFDIERELRTRNSGADEAISEAFNVDGKSPSSALKTPARSVKTESRLKKFNTISSIGAGNEIDLRNADLFALDNGTKLKNMIDPTPEAIKLQKDTSRGHYWSISLSQIHLFINDTVEAIIAKQRKGTLDREKMKENLLGYNMRAVVEYFVEPVTHQKKCGLGLLYHREEKHAPYMISHAWDESFGDLVRGIEWAYNIEKEAGRVQTKDEFYVWVCCFAIYQNKDTNHEPTISQQLGSTINGYPFYHVLKNSAKMYCIMSHGSDDYKKGTYGYSTGNIYTRMGIVN